jgi:hypothetical protein
MKPGRVPCCIPFCRRTFKCEDGIEETMCGKHYRLSPRSMRLRRRRVVRLYKKAMMRGSLVDQDRAAWLAYVLWQKIKASATEVAMGISV